MKGKIFSLSVISTFLLFLSIKKDVQIRRRMSILDQLTVRFIQVSDKNNLRAPQPAWFPLTYLSQTHALGTNRPHAVMASIAATLNSKGNRVLFIIFGPR